jgi:hypothetical protein
MGVDLRFLELLSRIPVEKPAAIAPETLIQLNILTTDLPTAWGLTSNVVAKGFELGGATPKPLHSNLVDRISLLCEHGRMRMAVAYMAHGGDYTNSVDTGAWDGRVDSLHQKLISVTLEADQQQIASLPRAALLSLGVATGHLMIELPLTPQIAAALTRADKLEVSFDIQPVRGILHPGSAVFKTNLATGRDAIRRFLGSCQS